MAFKDMDRLLQSFVDRGLPGCGCAIAQHGKTIYENYFGCADLETKAPVTESSLFRQYSLTKIPMYTLGMILFEKGFYLLNEPVYEYFPEWKDATKAVTNQDGTVDIRPLEKPILIRDLFVMTCGIPFDFGRTKNITQQEITRITRELQAKGPFTLREQLRAFSKAPIGFEPGTQWLYGMACDFCAGLIEVATGKKIEEAFKEYLFEPLGMKDTDSHYFGDAEQRMVKLYQKHPDGSFTITKGHDEMFDPSPEAEAGWARLFSTVRDYVKLTQMLANGGELNGVRVMGRKTIDLFRENHLQDHMFNSFTSSYNAGYGYGLGVRTLMNKAAAGSNGSLGAFGWTGGAGTWCEIDPSEGVSIVYMHNQSPNEEEYHHLRVRNVAYGCIE